MKKTLLWICGAILIIVLLVAYRYQPVDRSGALEFDAIEQAWLEEKSEIFFYTPEPLSNELAMFIRLMSMSLHVDLVEVDAVEALDQLPGFVMGTEPLQSWKDSSMSTALTRANIRFYGDDENYRSIHDLGNTSVGVIQETHEQLMTKEVKQRVTLDMVVYETESMMYKGFLAGEISLFVMDSMDYLVIHEGSILAHELFDVTLPESSTHLFTDNKDRMMVRVLDKAVNHIVEQDMMAPVYKDAYAKLEKTYFQAMLTEEEKEWIDSPQLFKVGLESLEPYLVSVDQQIYGILVGVLMNYESMTNHKFDYIIGDKDKLFEEKEQYDLDLIWTQQLNEEAEATTPKFMNAEYVVVGRGSTPSIYDINGLYEYRVGLLNDEPYNQVRLSTMPDGDYYFYDTYNQMIERLYTDQVNLMIVPEYVFHYYEGIYQQSFSDIPMVEEEYGGRPYAVNFFSILGVAIVIFGITYIRHIIDSKQMNHAFSHDYLTFLLNQYGMSRHMEKITGGRAKGALLLVDFNDFKQINNRIGHPGGDQILVEFSQRLLKMALPKFVVGRTGGDEFCLIVEDVNSQEAMEIAMKVKAVLAEYVQDNESIVKLSCSIAITLFPQHGSEFDQLYRYAEHTLDYANKQWGYNQQMIFTEEIYEVYLEELEIVTDLRKAFVEEEIELYIQPQVLLSTNDVIGGEVLIRWNHPERGLIFPDNFLPIAEKYSLMTNLDYYVLDHACKKIKELQKIFGKLKISVNLTPETLVDQNLAQTLEGLIDRYNIDPKYLVIEVTEDMGFDNIEKAQDIFSELKNMGVSIALDDFGKGYSSLSYLEHLSLDILKIDKNFVDNIHTNNKSRHIMNTIRRLAVDLNMDVVVEGVETQEQIDLLKAYKGIVVQGYYYSRPILYEAFKEFVRNNRNVDMVPLRVVTSLDA